MKKIIPFERPVRLKDIRDPNKAKEKINKQEYALAIPLSAWLLFIFVNLALLLIPNMVGIILQILLLLVMSMIRINPNIRNLSRAILIFEIIFMIIALIYSDSAMIMN